MHVDLGGDVVPSKMHVGCGVSTHASGLVLGRMLIWVINCYYGLYLPLLGLCSWAFGLGRYNNRCLYLFLMVSIPCGLFVHPLSSPINYLMFLWTSSQYLEFPSWRLSKSICQIFWVGLSGPTFPLSVSDVQPYNLRALGNPFWYLPKALVSGDIGYSSSSSMFRWNNTRSFGPWIHGF